VASQISRGRAAYWAARAAESAGDRAGAREWYRRASGYPSTFYGQLAAQKTGVRLPALMPLRARATEGARERMRRRDSAAVAQALCRLDGVGADAALPFFRHLGHEAADDPDELRAVAELGAGCGRPDLVVVAAKAAAKEGAEPDPDTAFPVPAVRGLRALDGSLPDPALRIAIARQESQFDPRAGSPAGALGMMQLMPATAKAVSERLGLPYSKTRLVRDAEYNVRLGSTYIKGQLDRYDGEAVLALAAYNAGPGRVSDWLRENGRPARRLGGALVDWIEMIPFAETRNYVQRVIEAREVYKVLLARERPSRAAAAATAASTIASRPRDASLAGRVRGACVFTPRHPARRELRAVAALAGEVGAVPASWPTCGGASSSSTPAALADASPCRLQAAHRRRARPRARRAGPSTPTACAGRCSTPTAARRISEVPGIWARCAPRMPAAALERQPGHAPPEFRRGRSGRPARPGLSVEARASSSRRPTSTTRDASARAAAAAGRLLLLQRWDAHGAASFGFRAVWLTVGQPAERLPGSRRHRPRPRGVCRLGRPRREAGR
jgi:soluble lytic murein transglycosylase-like protein